MAKQTRKFRPILAGTDVSRIIDALIERADRAPQGSADRIFTRHLADRLTIEWADWLKKVTP